MAKPQINWYENDVRLVVEDASAEMVSQLAFQTLGQAQINIQQNGQIDTGFLLNSGYVVSERDDTFGNTDPSGAYPSRKGGGTVQRVRVDQPRTPNDEGGAVVGFAAEYAIYQEMQNTYLYRALEQVAAQGGSTVQVTPR